MFSFFQLHILHHFCFGCVSEGLGHENKTRMLPPPPPKTTVEDPGMAWGVGVYQSRYLSALMSFPKYPNPINTSKMI